MKLSEIKIPLAFEMSTPRKEKMDVCDSYYREYGVLDRDLVLSTDGFLLDGYIGYLILCDHGVQEYPVVISDQSFQQIPPKHYWENSTIYVFGKHSNCDQEFVWRVGRRTTDVQNLKVGNHALVNTKHGPMNIIVTRIEELSRPPVPQSIRKVIRCFSD